MAEEAVSVALSANSTQFVKAFQTATGAVTGLGAAGANMAKNFGGTAAGIAREMGQLVANAKKYAIATGTGIAASAFAAKKSFDSWASVEQVMANVATVADTTGGSIAELTSKMVSMSTRIPKSVEDLATGLYDVESAGYAGAKALSVLEASARFGVAALTDTSTAVRGVTSIMAAYGLSAGSATHVTDVLFKAVQDGQMTGAEFTTQIGDWAAAAAQLNIPFESASAALAVITKGGTNAAAAATQLSGIMRALINPSKEMSATLKGLGYESGEAMLKSLGLAGTLKTLYDSVGGNSTAFGDLFQDVEGFRGAIVLANRLYGDFVKTDAKFRDQSQTAGTVDKAFATQANSISNRIALMKNQMRSMTLEVGKLVEPLVGAFVDLASRGVGALNSLPGPLRTVVAGFQAMGPLLVAVGGLFLAMKIKAMIFRGALGLIIDAIGKGGPLAKNFTFMTPFLQQMQRAGGPMALFRKGIMEIITNADGLRGAILRGAGTFGLYAGAATVAVAAITNLITSFEEAKAKAAALKSAMMQKINTGGVSSVAQLTDQWQQAIRAQNEYYDKSGGHGVINSALASLQMMVPFIENTKINALKASDAVADVVKSYKDLFNASSFLAADQQAANGALQETAKSFGMNDEQAKAFAATLEDTSAGFTHLNMSQDEVLAGLSQLSGQGKVDIATVVAAYKDLQKIMTSKEFGSAQLGMSLEKSLNPGTTKTIADFLPPEMAAQYTQLNGILQQTSDALAENANAAEGARRMMAHASASANDLAVALSKIIDSSSTANDRLQAYGDILTNSIGKTTSMRDAQSKFLSSLENVGASIRDNGANFDLATEKGQAFQSALSDANGAAQDLASTTYEQTGSMSQANAVLAGYIQGVLSLAQSAGFSQNQMMMLVAAMGATPDVISTLITLPGGAEAIAALGGVNNMLNYLNGYVAQAGVNITVTVDVATYTHAIADVGALPGMADAVATAKPRGNTAGDIQKAINDQVSKIKANIPKGKSGGGGRKGGGGGGGGRGGGGGGGGGGGAPKWSMTKAQAAAAAAALAAPIDQILNDSIIPSFWKVVNDQIGHAASVNSFMLGTTRIGAGILTAHQGSGDDPAKDMDDLANAYKDLVKLVGQDQANAAAQNFDSLENFKAFVDAVGEQIDRQRKMEDRDYQDNKIGTAAYLDLLNQRLVGVETYSDEWFSLMDDIKSAQEKQKQDEYDLNKNRTEYGSEDTATYRAFLMAKLATLQQYSNDYMAIWREIKQIDDDAKQAQDDALDEAHKAQSNRFDLGEINKNEYLNFLRAQLAGTEKYSDRYMDLWKEIDGITKDQQSELKDAQDGIKSFTDDVISNFNDLRNSIQDPITSATSMIAAFGTQATVTKDQVEGFYTHMKEGTVRWAAAIKGLQAEGANGAFLKDLVSQGPQSLTFAESILGMGQSGIDFINGAMRDIQAISSGLSMDIASAQIGTLVQNQQNYSINIGDVKIEGDLADGVTMDMVRDAVNQALAQAGAALGNRQS